MNVSNSSLIFLSFVTDKKIVVVFFIMKYESKVFPIQIIFIGLIHWRFTFTLLIYTYNCNFSGLTFRHLAWPRTLLLAFSLFFVVLILANLSRQYLLKLLALDLCVTVFIKNCSWAQFTCTFRRSSYNALKTSENFNKATHTVTKYSLQGKYKFN